MELGELTTVCFRIHSAMSEAKKSIKIKFYGTRGSIPVCARTFQDFGGNTSCITISQTGSSVLNVLDAGTGIRYLGKELLSNGQKLPKEITIGFSHFHWDHIQGFPFFEPAYRDDVQINILAMGNNRKIESLKEIFASQMQTNHFPVRLEQMGARFRFIVLGKRATQRANRMTVKAQLHNHPGGAYSFRIESGGKVLVVCTDIEHGTSVDQKIVDLATGADLLIHEAQYTQEQLENRRGWGHSSHEQAIEVADRAGVKHLIMTHHDPDHDDGFLRRIEKKCQKRFPNCQLAREGMEFEI